MQELCRAQIFLEKKVPFPGKSVFEFGQSMRSIVMTLLGTKGFWSSGAREPVADN
jgi:hypothetical protein